MKARWVRNVGTLFVLAFGSSAGFADDGIICVEFQEHLINVAGAISDEVDVSLPEPILVDVVERRIPESSGCGAGRALCEGRSYTEFTLGELPSEVVVSYRAVAGSMVNPETMCGETRLNRAGREVRPGEWVFTFEGQLKGGHEAFVDVCFQGLGVDGRRSVPLVLRLREVRVEED